MKVLVANLGSTSFKYRLYEMDAEEGALLARGGYERVENHGDVIADALQQLQTEGHISSPEDIDAVGFKTVLGRNLSGCVDADDRVLEALEGFAEVAPAHNPPYAAGIRQFREALPKARLVALFETAFYQWATPAATAYAVPRAWAEAGIRRYGFHGASHKYIAERSAQLLGRDDVATVAQNLYLHGPQPVEKPLRVLSLHLGGSSSVTAIKNGAALGNSMGFSPQSGLPQNNRVGGLDSGAIPYAAKALGLSLPEIERQLTTQGGLLGLSGVSNDIRDIREAAEKGNPDAAHALDVLVHECRRWASSYLFELGGLDAIVFTAGIGENGPLLRERICAGLEGFGLQLDPEKNAACLGTEAELSAAESKIKVFVIPANEELVLAREVYRKITNN